MTPHDIARIDARIRNSIWARRPKRKAWPSFGEAIVLIIGCAAMGVVLGLAAFWEATL
ncbi:MAG: hypothetical protein QM523_01175 [Candidatus Pacebacteria bacterium]|nr:hypothetical protein [Candidatus Paceibacterota bacterium]